MPDSSTPSDNPRQITGIILGRLVAPWTAHRDAESVEIQDGERIEDESSSWQAMGISAHVNAFFAHMAGEVSFHRMSELGRLIASNGERLGLVYTARVESELWREAIVAAPSPRNVEQQGSLASFMMAHRAFLDLQIMYLMSVGHGLANVAARFLALDGNLRAALARRIHNAPTFAPDSTKRSDWLSLSKAIAEKLRDTAQESEREAVIALIEPIVTYAASSDWQDLSERRGIDFHRWRPQTAGITGASVTSHFVQEDGSIRVPLSGPVEYHDADHLNDELDHLVNSAARGAVSSMAGFRANFRAAVSELISDELVLDF